MCVSKFLYYFKAIWVECSLISSWAAAHSVVEVGEVSVLYAILWILGLYWAVSSPRPWVFLSWCLLSQSLICQSSRALYWNSYSNCTVSVALSFSAVYLLLLQTFSEQLACLDTPLPVFPKCVKISLHQTSYMGAPGNLEWYIRFFHLHSFVTEATRLFPCYVGKKILRKFNM